MSSEVVIRVENLSKKYTLGKSGLESRGLRHALNDYATAPFRWLASRNGNKDLVLSTQNSELSNGDSSLAPSSLITHHSSLKDSFWALKDVTFDVKQGEVIGIIGRNGAGKSTLLKILSRITEPTTGRVGIKGRVASLLEVGTGFHPELTGRENIFLNGAILGMSRAEIKKKFDEIVAFAEVEKFLDTPVKRYSSGMYVRLAFAVAAHLDPEILLVDEVLAVGDAQFQKKCLGKMGEVAREGRTVLFVSHNLIAVQRLCKRGIVLDSGRAVTAGSVSACIDSYMTSNTAVGGSTGSVDLSQKPQAGAGAFRFLSLSVLDSNGREKQSLAIGQVFNINLTFELTRPHHELIIGFAIHTCDEFPLFATHNNDFGQTYSLEPGRYSVTMQFSPNYLRQGRYSISVGAISSSILLAHVQTAASLVVEPILSEDITHSDDRIGALFIPMQWSEPAPL